MNRHRDMPPRQQPPRLSGAETHDRSSRNLRTLPSQNLRQNLNPLQIAFTHRHQSHPFSVISNGRGHDISNERLQSNITEFALSDMIYGLYFLYII